MVDHAARHRFLASVAVVVHTIGFPVFVTPRAPWVEQNEPGCTVAAGGGFGFAVVGFGFGAAVVDFGFGAAVVGLGFGLVVVDFGLVVVGLASGRGVGGPLVRGAAGVGLSDGELVVDACASGDGLAVAVALSTTRSPTAEAVAVATATGFLSLSLSVSAPMVPTPQHNKTEMAAAIPTAPRFPIFFFPG